MYNSNNNSAVKETPNNILEIFIITYNRSKYLDDTLRQLVGCPFIAFPITILDNCSTDNTYDIYNKYQNQFPQLNYTKNKINIGADANILRAIEISNGRYTWVLCDDDDYDFSSCDDIFEELYKGEASAIFVGWAKNYTWPNQGYRDTPKKLIEYNFPYFGVPLFLPASIIKTDLFQRQIQDSYSNIVNRIPHGTYFMSLYDNDNLTYISKNKIVEAGGKAYDLSFLKVFVCVSNTCLLIKNTQLRQSALYHSYGSFKKILYGYMLLLASPKYNYIEKIRFISLFDWKHKMLFYLLGLLSPILINIPLPTKIMNIFFTDKDFFEKNFTNNIFFSVKTLLNHSS